MIYQGDCLAVLQTLPEASVDCCVTSPPYWGLRDYGIAGQLGMEQTPDQFVAALADVFDEVRRVLKPAGTCWVNLGDSYQNAKGQAHGVDPKQPARRHGLRPQDVSVPGLKPKDLVGIPWMFAFEARRRGWFLRADVIWSKPNPMPESVTDRPTKSHEYVFLLAKSKRYHYDAAAIAEPVSAAMVQQMTDGYDGEGTKNYAAVGVQNPSSVKARIIANARKRTKGTMLDESLDRRDGAKWNENNGRGFNCGMTRNKRSVWTIPTQAFPEAHFATFPEALVEPCIRAGCPDGGTVLDPFCGAGTTGVVAAKLNRAFVGIELNPAYIAIAERRIFDAAPLFAAAQEIA